MKRRWNSISGGTLLVLARPTRSGLLRDSLFRLFGDWGEPPLPRGKFRRCLAVRWANRGQLGWIQAVGGEARDVTEADFAPRVALDGCSSAESALRAQASIGENRAPEARSPAAGDALRWGELRASS